jgi:hypothetical protein
MGNFMKLNKMGLSITSLLAVAIFSTACSMQKASSNPGRVIDQSGGTTNDTGIDVTRGGDTTTDPDTSDSTTVVTPVVDPPSTFFTGEKVLLNQYPNTVPTTKVCRNVLNNRSVDVLKSFFNFDIVNLVGPVTVCIEQNNLASRCPAGETKCSGGVDRNVRFRIEYEDNNRFWYYDSAASNNYTKVLSYTGGGTSNNVEIILQDGAGFLMVSGSKANSTSAYDLEFRFVDRQNYSDAYNYDQNNGYSATSPYRRAATLDDMAVCAKASAGNALFTDGTSCATRFVFHYTFFTDMNTKYPATAITDTALWLRNQAAFARQLLINRSFSAVGGVFGKVSVYEL